MIKIAIDMQGGDNSYETTIPALKEFLETYPDSFVFACGDEDVLKQHFANMEERVEIVDAKDIIPMEAGVLDVLRLKNSPIIKGIGLIRDKKADAIVSSGSTGGFLSAATLTLKNIPGIKRAALVSPFPTFIKGKQTVVLDIGANNENSEIELAQFALMGRIYSNKIVGVPNPKVYLLSNGSEDMKGSPLVKNTAKLLKESSFPNFMGNVEANHALDGEADVVVCDGFTGNIFLKGLEGVLKYMGNSIKTTFKKNIASKVAYLMVRKSINEMNETLKYNHLGGAMLLGINGVCVKAHGNSKPDAFFHSIRIAYQLAKEDVITLLREGCRDELGRD